MRQQGLCTVTSNTTTTLTSTAIIVMSAVKYYVASSGYLSIHTSLHRPTFASIYYKTRSCLIAPFVCRYSPYLPCRMRRCSLCIFSSSATLGHKPNAQGSSRPQAHLCTSICALYTYFVLRCLANNQHVSSSYSARVHFVSYPLLVLHSLIDPIVT
jgi:hypothetical protein